MTLGEVTAHWRLLPHPANRDEGNVVSELDKEEGAKMLCVAAHGNPGAPFINLSLQHDDSMNRRLLNTFSMKSSTFACNPFRKKIQNSPPVDKEWYRVFHRLIS